MKEKLLEASLRRSVCQLGKERDDAFAVMKKSQLAHTLAVAKHENMQSELRQKLITVGLIREAWDDVRVDDVPAGTAGGDADGSSSSATASTGTVDGSADDGRTVAVDDADGANGAGVTFDGKCATNAGINGSADVEPDFDQDSEEFEAILLQNVIETEAKLAKTSGTLSASAVVVDSPVGVNVARSTEVGACASTVNGTVVVDTPVGDIGTVVVDTPPGISDTARKLKDVCLLIPTLSPNGKQNDLTGDKSKRNGSNVDPKSKKKAPSKTKRAKSILA